VSSPAVLAGFPCERRLRRYAPGPQAWSATGRTGCRRRSSRRLGTDRCATVEHVSRGSVDVILRFVRSDTEIRAGNERGHGASGSDSEASAGNGASK
jgi:hypothetical protein